jgi:CheY-like chemotaxis protein
MPDQSVILLAEDREDDILLIRRSFAKAFISNPLQVVRDGEELVAYLEGEGKFSNRDEYPLPDLLLLDLKMPRKDGFEVLQWIRAHPTLRALPVVVLTSSESMRDVNAAYQLGANSFLVKPMDFQNFVEMSRFINGFWLQMNKPPDTSRQPRKNGYKLDPPKSNAD